MRGSLQILYRTINVARVFVLAGDDKSPAALLAGSNDIEQYYNLDAKGMKNGLDMAIAEVGFGVKRSS